MATLAIPNAFQPPRKEKSKTAFKNSAGHLILEASDSTESGTGKNRRKVKPTSSARRRHGHTNRPLNLAAVHREEARRAARKKSRKPAPKRGDVTAAIFKDIVGATRGFLCASPTITRDADAFLDSVPSPKKSQPMAKVWPLMDAPVLQRVENASDEATG